MKATHVSFWLERVWLVSGCIIPRRVAATNASSDTQGARGNCTSRKSFAFGRVSWRMHSGTGLIILRKHLWVAQLCWLNKRIWEWNWKFEAWGRIVWPILEIGNRNPGEHPASPLPLSLTSVMRLQPLVCETDHLSIFGGVLNVPEARPLEPGPSVMGSLNPDLCLICRLNRWNLFYQSCWVLQELKQVCEVSGGQAKLSSYHICQSPSSLSSAKSRAFLKPKLTTVGVRQNYKKKTLPKTLMCCSFF